MEPTGKTCDQAAPDELIHAILQFNAGRWFECHETLEDLWAGEQGPARNLYQGMLMVAVALHHAREGNYAGAISLFGKAIKLLHEVAPICQEVDVAALILDTELVLGELEDLGPERVTELPPDVIPHVRFKNKEL